jgi:acyl transferase domain-containing protein/acyl carrier protein
MDERINALHTLSPKQLTLLTLRMQAKIEELEREKSEPIAILGLGCRFPGGSNDPESFWRFFQTGGDAIREIPAERWDIEAYYDPDPDAPGKMATRWGGFLEQVDQFDAAFFGISPREAQSMDPQQRLLLEVTWEALEHAAQPVHRLAGSKSGVFIGVLGNDYAYLDIADPLNIGAYNGTGTSHSIAAGRLSYVLDLRGPCVALDTACSSSLVAVHLACQSLRTHESDMALAGGVNLILSPLSTIGASHMRMMAADGRCKTFDRRADGFVRGEGCGIVVLKRLSDALQAGDPILAVIRGSAINQDGHSAGLTAPHLQAQQEVIRQALIQARVKPEQIDLIEAHGTGTSLGDPIEVEALCKVLGQPRSTPCWLASSKTNLGHTEAAAGIAGLLKVVLSLQHEQIPPHLHFESLNPNIHLEGTPFQIPTQLQPWPRNPQRRRYAGISSFGWSGTNAHLIIEEAPQREAEATPPARTPGALLALSARSPQALRELARRYHELLTSPSAPALVNLCATAALRRTHHPYRLARAGQDAQALADLLSAFLTGESRADAAFSGQEPRIVFVFPGQGSQWIGMGQELLREEPVFARAIDDCEQAMRPYLDWSLREQLLAPAASSRLQEIAVVQPLLFAMHVALARLWISWGILPAAVIGHSMGEVAAAYLAGILSLPDAALLICRRSQLLTSLRGQGMMAQIELALEQARLWLANEPGASIAASNGPRTTIFSGERASIQRLLARAQREGLFCRAIQVDVASHSPLVEPLRQDLLREFAHLAPQAGKIPLYSTVLSDWLAGQQADAGYWMSNLREAVAFWPAVQQMVAQGYRTYVEVSPHPILVSALEEGIPPEQGSVVGSLRRDQAERLTLLQSLGRLYEQGAAVNWEAVYPQERYTWTSLPAYPWQRQRFWLEERTHGTLAPRAALPGRQTLHPLLGRALDLSLHTGTPATYVWETELVAREGSYLSEHRVQGTLVLPATAYLEMIQAAAREVFQRQAVIQQVEFRQMLILSSERARNIQLVLHQELPEQATVQLFSRQPADDDSSAGWQLHATARLLATTQQQAWPACFDSVMAQARLPNQLSGNQHYELTRTHGIDYGESFQGIQRLWSGKDEALARLAVPAAITGELEKYTYHPALLDAAFQVLGAALAGKIETAAAGQRKVFVPVSLASLRGTARLADAVWAHARLADESQGEQSTEDVTGDLALFAADGQCVLEARGLRLRTLESDRRGEEGAGLMDWLFVPHWQMTECLPALAPRPEGTGAGRNWLLFADEHGVGQRLEQALHEQGERCVLVRAGSKYQRVDAQHFLIDQAQPDHFRRLLKEALEAPHAAFQGIIYLWALDPVNREKLARSALQDIHQSGYNSVLLLVQAVVQAGWRDAPRLWLVTDGVHLSAEEARRDPRPREISPQLMIQAPLWGMSRVIQHEHADLRCSCVDLSPAREDAEVTALFREIWYDGREDQVRLHGTSRFVARLLPLQDQPAADLLSAGKENRLISADATPYRVEVSRIGLLDSLTLRQAPPRSALRAREVRIKVYASGLNFSDIMKVMGIYPGQPDGYVPLGVECAGVILECGQEVTAFQTGDEVIALAPGSLASEVVVDVAFLVQKPATLNFTEAAGIASAFLTAFYALITTGHLQKGERVLIHSASGGVGLAAIQIAQQTGAEIFATAGTEEKRAYLRSLGIQYVMDSRSLAFGEQVMTATQGRGVDVVLNTLTGEAIDQNFSLLAPLGRFLELGKKDIYQNRQLGLGHFRHNLAYFAIDLEGLFKTYPDLAGKLLREVMERFATGQFRPLPSRVYPIGEISDALRSFSQARHIGKLIMALEGENPLIEVRAVAERASVIRADGAYLITGGLGGLGLRVAQWLTEQGARHLALLGRHDPVPEAQQAIEALEAAGVHVLVARCDVAEHEQLERVFQTLAREMPPLRGVIHAAVTLDDGIVLRQTPERFQTVMAAKIPGTWNLHQLTQDLTLDFFVLFSTAGALLGSPGQINYAAASTFLDTLAHQRQRLGLPALSINWGPWAEIGQAAREKRGERLSSRGVASLTPQQGLAALTYLLSRNHAQVAVMSFHARQWRQYYPKTAEAPFIALLDQEQGRQGTTMHPMRQELERCAPQQRVAKLENHLREQIAHVLRLDAQQIERLTPLTNLGFDSLMALELRNRLELSLGIKLSATLVWAYPTLIAMTHYLLEQMELLEQPAPLPEPSRPEPQAPDAGPDELEMLSEQEMAALLAEEIASFRRKETR